MPTAALAKDLVEALKSRGWKLTLAESMTGGLVAGALTAVPTSGDVFPGGLVSYSDSVKADHLGVDPKTLEAKGAVTAEVAKAMAKGALDRFHADLAVSVTGFAGPDVPKGGEVGLVHFGLATRGRVTSKEVHFGGDRESIRRQAVDEALAMALAAARAP